MINCFFFTWWEPGGLDRGAGGSGAAPPRLCRGRERLPSRHLAPSTQSTLISTWPPHPRFDLSRDWAINLCNVQPINQSTNQPTRHLVVGNKSNRLWGGQSGRGLKLDWGTSGMRIGSFFVILVIFGDGEGRRDNWAHHSLLPGGRAEHQVQCQSGSELLQKQKPHWPPHEGQGGPRRLHCDWQ